MKKIKTGLIALTLICIIGLTGYSQGYYEWGDPFPLTDSLSDNSNPSMYLIYNTGLYMVWEKQIDSVSTSIFMDNILDAEPAQEVLSANGVLYRNPQIMNANYYPNCDSVFFLVYETNENGNIDIYFKAYMTDGSFLPAEPLVTTPFDDYQLTVGQIDYWDGGGYFRDAALYIRNDSLFARNLMRDGWYIYFDDEDLIDSSFCSSPVALDNYVSYLKEEDGEFHIYHSSCNNSGNWGAPQVMYDSADCRNLDFSLHYGNLVWSAYKDTTWRIMTLDLWGGETYTYDIFKETPFDPAALGLIIGVKSWWGESWIATPFPENDLDEIFMTEWAGVSNFLNFSQSGTMNRNPHFFIGEPTNYCQYDYLVWESFRNEHWQIWASKVIQCAGSVSETDLDEQFMSVHPNPFTHETTIEFTLDLRRDVIIEVYDNRGTKAGSIANQSYDQGEHQLRWNGEGLPAGVYIVKIIVEGKIYSSKLIKKR